jgi:hypothetical protein
LRQPRQLLAEEMHRMEMYIFCSDVGHDVIVLFSTGSNMVALFRENTDNTGNNFVVDYQLVVFPYDVDTAFLC